jgi:large subunit ribosomal protein L3
LAYLPRGRANRPIGKINHWPQVDVETPKLIGFAGYKVGMSFVYFISSKRGSPTFGQEVYSPVTFIETPPIFVCGLRAYSKTPHGLKAETEVWAQKLPKDLETHFSQARRTDDSSLETIEANGHDTAEYRAIVCTQPRLSNVPQKKPELFEVKVTGGTLKDQLEYLKGFIGQELGFSDVFKEGQLIDVIAVTKGKGIQGPVKRWGVKKLHHKNNKTVRGIGTLGPWTPHYVMYSVPRAGQMGFHQRTEINKRVLKIEENTEPFAPDGGFPHYGVIRNTYVILEGSIPGPAKRVVKLRYAARPKSSASEAAPNITFVGVQPQKA